jgi:hypothetical protein
MSTKTSNNSTLAIIILIITFPFWIGILCGVIGLAAGVFGIIVGIIGAVFGAIFGAFGAVFEIFDWVSSPFGHISAFRFFVIIAIIFAAVMISRSNKKK